MKAALIGRCLTDQERKPLNRLAAELLQSTIKNRGFPSYYFHNFLYRNGVENHVDYITDREIRRIKPFVLNKELEHFFSNKLLFHLSFEETDIKLPDLIGYNVGNRFVTKQRAGKPLSPDLNEALRVLPGLTDAGYVFIKPINGGKGRGCVKLTEEATDHEIDSIQARLSDASYIFEEGLAQHPILNELYPHSVNTARVVSCRLNDGSIHLLAAKLRVGQGNMVIDNSSAGGMSVHIDLNSGQLGDSAMMPYKKSCKIIGCHPDTGVRFSGFTLPDIEKMKRLVLKASVHLPYRLIGWDVAFANEGPVLIEGNDRPHISGSELVYGGLRKNPVFRRFLKEAEERVT